MYERYIQVKRVKWAKQLVELYNHADKQKFLNSYILDETHGVANCARKEPMSKTKEILTLEIHGNREKPEAIRINGTKRVGYICPHNQVWVKYPYRPESEKEDIFAIFG